jgi:vacuolar protein sorting-associated protein IST1
MGNGIKYNQGHLKANLQMGISRLTLMKNKKINQIALIKDEIASLLHSGKEEMAMVKVESIINHENFITAVEVLMMYCAQLIERVFQIGSSDKCPPDIRIAVETIIWASTKIDCKELIEARQDLGAKFGFEFCRHAADNKDGYVNSIIRDKLVNTVPEEEMKVVKIQEIASEKRIDFVFKHSIRQVRII